MAKKKTSKKKTSSRKKSADATGKQLVIVESPAKAKTINKYLGPDYVVEASVGHVRDLPSRAPKGQKQPVPGVDLESDFEPTYEVLTNKKKNVTELKKLAKQASDVWFATDLDREGEAIAWHLAELLGEDPTTAKRVVFNAITKDAIQAAFDKPHAIDIDKVNAQQARRILDRIVGYQVSPLLWKKVASGLSAGRVQSVAVRLVVEREREIRAHVPDESWSVGVRLALDPGAADALGGDWSALLAKKDENGKGPTQKAKDAWLADHDAFTADLVEIDGERFTLGRTAEEYATAREAGGEDPGLDSTVVRVSEAAGLTDVSLDIVADDRGKGPASRTVKVSGRTAPGVRYAVDSIEKTRRKDRPNPPFITSSMQRAASSFLGFGAKRTMGAAQRLYEGVNVPGEGQVGVITYMRTDSTHLSGQALGMARDYIKERFGDEYLPEKPNFYGSSNKDAQEAHEAIRPTDPRRHPDEIAQIRGLGDDEKRLYRLIWERFVACQMTPAEIDQTTVRFKRSDEDTGAILRTSGSMVAFDGHRRVNRAAGRGSSQPLPSFTEGDESAAFSIEPEQSFSSPPRRYSEAALIQKLEEEGIGRPSTYASIISVIQDRNYVELVGKAFHATDLGEVVTDKLMEGFPELMDLQYTRKMEAELDKVADQDRDWKAMLHEFYGPFTSALANAHESMTHAKAEQQPAPYACPECGSRTNYRFGKNGRFLSCSDYPNCKYAAPIDREGRPVLTERVDILGPDGEPMELRSGRFGKFIAPANYGKDKTREDEFKAAILNLDNKGGLKHPSQPPITTDLACEKCDKPLYLRRGKRAPWLGCSGFPKCRGRGSWAELEDEQKAAFEAQLDENDIKHPPIVPVRASNREPIPAGTPIADLILAAEGVDLEIHPDAAAEAAAPGDRAA